MESFNGEFRDECLNLNWFMNVGHAREVVEAYRLDYNNERLHSSLDDLTQAEFIKSLEEANTVGVLQFRNRVTRVYPWRMPPGAMSAIAGRSRAFPDAVRSSVACLLRKVTKGFARGYLLCLAQRMGGRGP
jgi:hypothetical protein